MTTPANGAISQAVMEQELASAKLVPPLYVNRVQVTASEVIRLAFGESLYGEPSGFRVAVVMTRENARRRWRGQQ